MASWGSHDQRTPHREGLARAALAKRTGLRRAIDEAFPWAGVEVLQGGDHGAKIAAERRSMLERARGLPPRERALVVKDAALPAGQSMSVSARGRLAVDRIPSSCGRVARDIPAALHAYLAQTGKLLAGAALHAGIPASPVIAPHAKHR